MDHQQPMKPLPALERYARTIELKKSGLNLFAYQTGPGDAPGLILVHGLGDDADTWRHIFLPLAEFYLVTAFDLPGFGRSDKPSRPYSMDFFQQVFLELVDVLGFPRLSLVGHSLGGMITHLFSLEQPEIVKHLVLVSGSLLVKQQKMNLTSLLMLIPGLGEWFYNRLRNDPQAAFDTLYPYYATLAAMPAEEKAFLFDRVNQRVWDDAQRRAYFSTLRNMAGWILPLQRTLPGRLAKWRIPTRVIWGEKDLITSPMNGAALAQIQPFTQFKAIPGAGHNVQQDAPQALLEEILTALSA